MPQIVMANKHNYQITCAHPEVNHTKLHNVMAHNHPYQITTNIDFEVTLDSGSRASAGATILAGHPRACHGNYN